MKPFFANHEKPLLFGHRGYSSLAPENTMEAFKLCVEHNIPGVELDVHLCKTGELVVIHDHDLKRLAGIEGLVEDLSFDELRALDVGSHKSLEFKGARIPLLSDLFATFGNKLYYDVELKVSGTKDTGIGKKTWETITEFNLEDYCMVSSFNPFSIRYFNRYSHKRIPSAVIYCVSDKVPRILQKGGGRFLAQASVLKPIHKQVTARMMTKFRTSKGYPICTWTVDDLDTAVRVLDLNVDGIISNGSFRVVK
jgi:glycerophosphoryl diester phosphodiesterase